MSEWKVYNTKGVEKAQVKELELHDEWMAECYLVVTVKSANPVNFQIGDYINYRGERYSINYDPTVLKKARKGTYGEGFVYDSIKFVSDSQSKIVGCDFTDIVLDDNQMHYTGLPTFPFYCESVDDLLDRVQACLEELYPGRFILIGLNTSRNAQRGLAVGRESDFVNAYKQYVDPTGAEKTDSYGKTSVALSVDNITCWEAITKINSDFGLNFIMRGDVVIAGINGVFTPDTFRYGKGNGLYEIERISEQDQQVITRLKAYGSEDNIPNRYYAELNMQVFGNVAGIVDKTKDNWHQVSFWIDLDYSTKFFKERSTDNPTMQGSAVFLVRIQANGITANAFAYKNETRDYCYLCVRYIPDGADDLCETNMATADAFIDALNEGDRIDFVSGVEKSAFPADHTSYATENLPNNMSVSRLMLPGFPNQSLYDWVKEHGGTDCDDERGIATINGFTGYFSKDKHHPWLQSLKAENYGIRPGNIYFDGSNDTENIHPTLEGMKYGGHDVDVVAAAEQITDNGVYGEGNVPNFTITLPNLGFDLAEVFEEGATIDMKDGMCGSRSFKMANRPIKNSNGQWECKVERVRDDSLDLWFPYKDFPIKAGDHYVLTGIKLPDEYVSAASEKLFEAAIEALQKNDTTRFTYQPRIDEIWMARQHDTAIKNGETSLHDTIHAGDIFLFKDDDLGIDEGVIIDVLTIRERGNDGIPTYEVTLRNEKQVSSIQRMIDKAVSNASGGGAGGVSYTSRQIQSLIENYGNDYFLSKTGDDEAHGLIGFINGFWVKTKGLFGFDGDGNIKANDINADGSATVGGDASVRGKFDVYGQATINDIKSRSYSGTGLADTGWAVTNDNGNGSSHAVFDYITIRKKMIVNALEIKETHFSAGDVAHTLAAAEIARTDYLYVDAGGRETLLGYSQVKVPWLLRGAALLLGKESFASRRLLTHYKKVRMTLTNDDLSVCNRVRCYFLAKDGDREIENWFRVGDLVRCQTWNIVKTRRETFIPNLEDHAGNVYWWRKITDVSWNTGVQRYVAKDASGQPTENTTTDINSAYINEGGIPRIANNGTYGTPDIKHSPKTIDGNTYHWFDVTFGYDAERSGEANWCDTGSDLPAAGDKVVQFGNAIDPDRMNIFMIEVNGAGNPDAPDWKMYRGVYTFNLTNCWWGGESCRKTKWSVATGIEAYAPQFNWITEYGIARQVFVRDEVYWNKIPFERDDDWSKAISSYPDYSDDIVDANGRFVSRADGSPKNYVRKCRYYEQVSHNGSAWLCSVVESFYWRSADGRKLPAKTDGAEYVRNYTYDEPSAESNNWTEQVEKGDPGAFKSSAFCLTNMDISSYKPKGGTTGSPVPTSTENASGTVVTTIQWHDAIPDGTAQRWITTAWFYSDGTHSEWAPPRRESDTETSDVEYSPAAAQPAAPTGTAADKDTTATRTARHNQGGTNMGWFDPSESLSGTGWTWPDMVWRAERKIKNGEYYGAWVITRIKGENSVRLDLSHDNETMLYSSSKGLVSGNVTSVATLWDGNTDVSDSVDSAGNKRVTWSMTAHPGCNATFNATTHTITVTGMSAISGYVEVRAVYTDKKKKTTTVTIRLNLKKLVDADKYDLEITPNSIAYNITKDDPKKTTLTIRVFRSYINSSGGVTRENTVSLPSGYYVFAGETQLVGNTSTLTYTHETDNSEISEVQVKIATSASATDFLDCETIPVVKAENGDNGDTPMMAFQWNSSPTTAPTKPSTGQYNNGWTATAPNRPTTTGDHYLWMVQAVKHTSKSGTASYDAWGTPVRISGDKGEAGEDSKEREWIYVPKTKITTFSGDTLPANITKDVNGVIRDHDTYIIVTDDFVPYGWFDNAMALDDTTNKYIYASYRDWDKTTQKWGDFITPILWGNWGQMGIDGDGVQYLYKLFAAELTDAERTSNIPANPTFNEQTGEWEAEGWSDDPQAPTSTMKFCYCSVIKRINDKWGTFGKLGMWSNYSEDGKSVESYMAYQEAWGDSASTHPTSGWSDSTPAKNARYLWRRSRLMTLRADKSGYDGGEWGNYLCLSGTDGTSIAIKGHVPTISNLPTSHSDGDAYVVDGDNGHGETGHLFMWSDEAENWIDIGKFQGDEGATYFTHIAWGKGVTIGTPTSSRTTGQKTTPNASACENFSISPADGYDWMGILVDQVETDSTDWRYYTWKEVKGTQGDTIRSVSIYKWSAEQPAKPTSSNIPPSGWNTVDSGTHDSDAQLWMCWGTAVNGVLSSDGWSGPVRMSGKDGEPGADGEIFEYIYFQTNVLNGYGVHPKTISAGEVSPTGTAEGTDTNKQQDDWVPNGWSDNAHGVSTLCKYEYCAIREKKNKVWGDFGDPFPFSVYGDKGQDGDGVQYIYKLFDTELTDAQCDSDAYKPKKTTQNADGEWLPVTVNGVQDDSWKDDPISPTSEHQYCYCATIKRVNGSWLDYEKISLWANYSDSITMVEHWVRYAVTDDNSKPSSDKFTYDNYPTGVADGKYIWTWTHVKYSNNAESNAYSVSRTGIDGKGVKSVVVKYCQKQDTDTSPEDFPETDWGDYPTNLNQGWWLYTRTKTIYSNDDTTYSYSSSQIGTGSHYAGCQEYYAVGASATVAPNGAPTAGTYGAGSEIQIGSNWHQGSRPAGSESTPYLWNFEISADSQGNRYVTDAICIGNWTKGIVAIIELYAISAESVLSESVKALPWTDEQQDAAPTENEPYQWNKTIVAYNNSVHDTSADTWDDSTCDVYYHISAVRGADGNGIRSIARTYARSTQSTSANDTTAPTGIDTTVGTDGWADASPAVTEEYPYLWAREVVTYTKTGSTTKYYCIGARGDNGVDAQDAEWVYIRTKTNVAPVISGDGGSNPYTDHNGKTYTADDHLPKVVAGSGGSLSDIESDNSGSSSKLYECTDDPKGVDETWKYEWEIKRTKGTATNGHRSWNAYSGTMTLHNNFAESALVIDVDNDNDQFGVDSDGKVVSAQVRSTVVSMLYGTQEQAFTSAPTYLLRYDDNSSVDSSVATVGVEAVSGTDNKEYRITVTVKSTGSNTPVFGENGMNGMYVDISGTCARGTKTIRFALEKVMSGEPGQSPTIYQLVLSQKSLSFGRDASNNLTAKSNSVTVSVKETIGDSSTIKTLAESGKTCSYGFDGTYDTFTVDTNNPVITVSPANVGNHTRVSVLLSTGDKEEIPIVVDGAKGDDVPYYVKDYALSASRELTNGVPTIYGSWSSNQPVPTTQYPYVWERNRLYNPNTNQYSNTTYVCLTGAQGGQGPQGAAAWAFSANPANVIITQSLNNKLTSFSSAKVSFAAKKGRESATITSIAIPTGQQALSNEFNATIGTGDDAKKVIVSSPKTHGSPAEYYTEGSFKVVVNAQAPDGSTSSQEVTVLCYANLLGTWKRNVVGDAESVAAAKVAYIYDPNNPNQVVKMETFGNYVRSSTQNSAKLERDTTEIVKNIDNTAFVNIEDTQVALSAGEYIVQLKVDTEDLPTGNYVFDFAGFHYEGGEQFIEQHITVATSGTYTITLHDEIQSGNGVATMLYIGRVFNVASEITQTADRISTTVKNISPTKNLLKGSLSAKGWSTSNAGAFTPNPGIKSAVLTSDGYISMADADTNTWLSKSGISLSTGKKYTLSFLAKVTTAISYKLFFIYNSQPQVVKEGTVPSVTATTIRRKVSIENIPLASTAFYLTLNCKAIKQPQLEEGDTATDFIADSAEISSGITQTADNIQLFVTHGLSNTGIDITNGTIKLQADKVTFCDANGENTDKIWIDPTNGTLHAVDGHFSGEITATSGSIGGFGITGSQISSLNNNIILKSDGSATLGGFKVATNGTASLTSTLTVGDANSQRIEIIPFDKNKLGSGTINFINADSDKILKIGFYNDYYGSIDLYSPATKQNPEECAVSVRSNYLQISSENTYNGKESHITMLTSTNNVYSQYTFDDKVNKMFLTSGVEGGTLMLRAYKPNGSSAWPVCSLDPTGANWMDKGHVHVMTMGELKILLENPNSIYSSHLANYAVMLTRINGN